MVGLDDLKVCFQPTWFWLHHLFGPADFHPMLAKFQLTEVPVGVILHPNIILWCTNIYPLNHMAFYRWHTSTKCVKLPSTASVSCSAQPARLAQPQHGNGFLISCTWQAGTAGETGFLPWNTAMLIFTVACFLSAQQHQRSSQGNMLGPECAHLGQCPLFCSPKSLHPLLPFLLVLSYVVSTSWVKEIGKCRKLQAKDRELKGLHVLEKAAQHQREPEPLLKGCRNFSIKPFKAIHTIPAWKAQKDTDISYGLTKSKSVVNR